jgi:hypothetical protein
LTLLDIRKTKIRSVQEGSALDNGGGAKRGSQGSGRIGLPPAEKLNYRGNDYVLTGSLVYAGAVQH